MGRSFLFYLCFFPGLAGDIPRGSCVPAWLLGWKNAFASAALGFRIGGA